MKWTLLVTVLLSFAVSAQYGGYGDWVSFPPDDDYNPVDADAILVLRSDRGVTATNGEVDTWEDQTNNNNDFTGTTTTRPTLVGDYIDFDSDDYLISAAGGGAALAPGTGDFTWEADIECASYAGTEYIIGSRATSTVRYNFYSNTSNGMNVYAQNTTLGVSCQSANNVLINGSRHYVAFVGDRDGSGTFYVDGQPISTTTSTMNATNITNATTIAVGARNIPLFFITGKMRFVRMTNRIRTPREIATTYAWLQKNF